MKNSAPSGGPRKCAHAADHGHGQDLAGEDDVHPIGRDEVVQIGAEAAREAECRGREHEGDQLVAADRVAHEQRALLVLADRDQNVAEGRADHAPDQDGGEEHDDRGHDVERGLIVEIDAQQVGPGDAAEAVLAAGERGPAVDDVEGHRGEREREQREVDAAPAQDEEADERPVSAARATAKAIARRKELGREVELEQRRGVGGEPEERAVAEREQAGVAEQQVEAEADQHEQRDLARDRDRQAERAGEERQDDERRREDQERVAEDPEAAHSSFATFSPISPRGRSSRTRTMSAYIEASAAGG